MSWLALEVFYGTQVVYILKPVAHFNGFWMSAVFYSYENR